MRPSSTDTAGGFATTYRRLSLLWNDARLRRPLVMSRDRSRGGKLDLSCSQVLEDLKTDPPPTRLVPRKNITTSSCRESEELPEIYSPGTSWIRVAQNSKISYEVDAQEIKGLIPIERPATPPPVIDQEKVQQRKLQAFRKKYEKHRKIWREYQFDRQFLNCKIKSEGEKPSVLLQTHDVPSSCESNAIWRNAVSPTRLQQQLARPQAPDLIVPPITKAYRRSDVTYTEHNVISSIKKARAAFPNTVEYKKDYTPVERNLFMSSIAKELIPKPNFRQGITGNGDFLRSGTGRSRSQNV